MTINDRPKTTRQQNGEGAHQNASDNKKHVPALEKKETGRSGTTVEMVTAQDLDRIWAWNGTVPSTVNRYVDELIEETVKADPDALAICAWDGEITYGQLDDFATRLAGRLVAEGVVDGQIVPLCFNKSKWTTVAILAVLKAGGAFVLLDSSLPEKRNRSIVEQIGTSIILAAPSSADLGAQLCSKVVQVHQDFIESLPHFVQPRSKTRPDPSVSPMYAIFTSGSTGIPKCAVLTHSSGASAIMHQIEPIGFRKDSRVFDFSSYAFDASVHNVISTLLSGGCLCVPSEKDRLDNVNKAMASLRATIVDVTPTVSRLLDPNMLPDLKTLILLGEAVRATDASRWQGKVNFVNAYGPCECTPISTVNIDASNPEEATSIGKAVGAVTWVVDPENYNRLVPPGCIGELLLEGPLVGRGYLNNPEKTAQAFVDTPTWLRQGTRSWPGREARLYRTGDLVQYRDDGSLRYIGRKDTQVKIRGRRIELEEIEIQVQQCVPEIATVVAEVITPKGTNSQPMLVAFVLKKAGTVRSQASSELTIFEISQVSKDELANHLPSYMIPAAFLLLDHLPKTATAKTDRKTLREMGAQLTIQQLASALTNGSEEKRQPTTNIEIQMQKIWCEILGLELDMIGADDSFLKLGGDSFAAMKVVAAARELYFELTVADIMQYPALNQVASRAKPLNNAGLERVAPFSLLGAKPVARAVLERIVSQYQFDPNIIQDIYPCSPLQEGLMSLSMKRPGDYVLQAVLDLSPNVNIQALRTAWEEVVRSMPLLRTTFLMDPHYDLLQIVLDEAITWREVSSLDAYLEDDKKQPMDSKKPFTRFALVKDVAGNYTHLVWTVHHALYDAWTLPLITNAVDQAYKGYAVKFQGEFQAFIKYTRGQDEAQVENYWKNALANCESIPFPARNISEQDRATCSIVEHRMPVPSLSDTDVTISTLLRGAWALVASNMTNSDDVVFGLIVAGRNAPVAGIHQMAAPTIATVPLRVNASKDQTISQFTSNIQRQGVDMIPFEQTGLQHISKFSSDCQRACMFETLLVIRPQEQEHQTVLGTWHDDDRSERFNTYGLTVEVQLGAETMLIRAMYNPNMLEPWIAKKLVARLERVVLQLSHPGAAKHIGDIQMLTGEDLKQIWDWNRTVPPTINRYVDEMVEDRVQANPDAPAVCAWDGELTYGELNRLAQRLASRLIEVGIEPDAIVPLCFEKSMWTPVAALAVLKAGAAFVLLDPSLPEQRLQTIVHQVKAQTVLSSADKVALSLRLCSSVIQVSGDAIERMNTDIKVQHRARPSSASMYVVFTSGSTGVPKGAVLTHANFCSNFEHQAKLLGFTRSSRVFDFASYSFDIAVENVFITLSMGGCLCIPSDADRKDNIEGAMASMRVTLADFTPSVARLLKPSALPTLETLVLGGEAVCADDVVPWWGKVRVVNGYGPAECTITSTINNSASTPQEISNIGKGVGLVTWVVDPEDHQRLLPPGCTGELLLEGPLVGKGYLGEPEKTAAAFIKDPVWLLKGLSEGAGRQGRLYKTGDLVKYNSNGTFSFLGRKDAQLKIHGQRVDPGEIEHWIQEYMPEADLVAVEVVTPQGDNASPMLAAFVQAIDGNSKPDAVDILQIPAELVRRLSGRLPSYMIPSVFFAAKKLPLTPTGKTNRKRLREIGASFSAQMLADAKTAQAGPRRMPTTANEYQIQQIWARVLGIEASSIGLDDSFIQLGGDSISAMKIVALARNIGLELSVANIFQSSTLYHLAGQARSSIHQVKPVEPFSLLGSECDLKSLLRDISAQYKLEPHAIQDVFPCTPLQEGLMSLTMRRPGDYILQGVIELPEDANFNDFRNAWGEVARKVPTLRTRIVQHDTFGMLQVVLDEEIAWVEATGLDAYLDANKGHTMQIGQPLTEYALIEDQTGSERWFVWTIHHALYDGWSMSLIMDSASRAYQGQAIEQGPQFQTFVKYVLDQSQDRATDYWVKALQGCDAAPFPSPRSSVETPKADSIVEHSIPYTEKQSLGITTSTLIRAAWALIASQMTDSNDVVFGVTVSGRNAPVPGMDNITGPTIATVPVRIQLSKNETILDYLQRINNQAIDMIPFEQTGIQSIAKMCADNQKACRFQTLLVVQPQSTAEAEDVLGEWKDYSQTQQFNTYGLMVEVFLEGDKLTAKASFDSHIIEPWVVHKLLGRLGSILQQFSSFSPEETLNGMDMLTAEDVDEIWNWNETVPQPADICVHQLMQEKAAAQPDAMAICAWDGEITYGELDKLSTQLARHLVSAGVRPGTFVPICIEKSKWTTVAILATMKAGGAFVLLEHSLPMQRLQSMVEKLRPQLIISSPLNHSISSKLCGNVMVIDTELFHQDQVKTAEKLPAPSLDSINYVIFTSGTTGVPKGALINHRNSASAVQHQSGVLGYNSGTRLYDFSSYSFDVSILAVFAVLTTGGCLCVPTDDGRKNDLTGSIKSLKANSLWLTPSVTRLLSPEDLPSVRSMVLGGEAVSVADVQPWWGRVSSSYGPCECTPATMGTPYPSSPDDAVRLGKGLGVNTWVVDPEDHNSLLPLGCVGELVLEGPLVGVGYLDEPEKTAAAFIENPKWLLQGSASTEGRSGRLYKTGDLVRYSQDGSLSFIGRKDGQVKIRGQRVEPADIESHILQSMPELSQVVVDIIVPRGEDSSPALVAFLQKDEHATTQVKDSSNSHAEGAEIMAIPTDVRSKLAKVLPRYMIPTAFFSLPKLPLGATGKMDRRRLRDIGSSFSNQQLAEVQTDVSGPKRAPETDMERQIQDIWAHVLKIEPAKIGIDDGFLQLGGDSIAAMKAVGKARQQGLNFTVADIFTCPTLSHLAKTAGHVVNADVEHIDAFSLLSKDTDDVSALIKDVSSRFQMDASKIQDAYPCTPLQEGLLSLTLKSPGDYVMQATLELSQEISEKRFRHAWEKVAQQMPILRTRIVPDKNHGLLQVVLNESIDWVETEDLGSYLKTDGQHAMKLGQRLSRYAIVKSNVGTSRFFVWTVHHALYDGWSMTLLMDALKAAYHGNTISQGPQFQSFIKYAQAQGESSTSEFWRTYLDGCVASPFPSLPLSVGEPDANDAMDHHLKLPQNRHLGITTSTLIRAAWALVVSRMTNSDDVIFGVTSFGRNVPIANIENMAAPTMATVPVRVRLPSKQTVAEYTNSVQRQTTEMIPFEQSGLSQISKISSDCEQACMFQTLLVIQPQPQETNDAEDTLGKWDQDSQGQWSNTYSLVIETLLGPDEIVIKTNFDARVIEPWIVKKLLGSLETVMHQLAGAEPHKLVSDIDTMTTQDLDQIWTWNAVTPNPVDRCIHDIVSERARTQPEALALDAWDGELTYGELEQLATRFAHQLTEIGVGPEVLVPLCFEKSMWTTVAMLAVLKAGGAFVLLDTSLPEQRLRIMVEKVGSSLIVSSVANMELSSNLSKRVVQLGPELRGRPSPTTPGLVSQAPSSSSAMFLVFTSGSTGVPKAIVITHSNFASSLQYQSKMMGFTEKTRVFDFASYAFDAAVESVLMTLATGGCICVPSDNDRKGNIGMAMKAMRVTIIDLTPTVARLVNPESLPDVETVILSGEAAMVEDMARWWGKAQVINIYGPAECTINSTINASAPSPEKAVHIGKGVGLVTWVVDPDDHNVLMPPGSVGELLLEGPLVGRGYLNEPEKTAAAFIEDPTWLLAGAGGRPGRRGRLYKTGDLVQYNEDGSLVFHGRKDFQVKIRGQRVELGEIEHRVQDALPGAPQVAVEVVKPQSGKGTLLVAAFVAMPDISVDKSGASPEAILIPRETEEKLAEHLPRYMIPTVVFKMAALPMTPSGKTNRKRLREIGATISTEQLCDMQLAESGSKRQPTTEMEYKLQAIWAQVLGVDKSLIGLEDNFFRLGGDSIAAMKAVGEAGNLGLEISVVDMFRHPRLEDMSQKMVPDKNRSSAIPALGLSGLVSQSFAQERLWFLEQLHPGLTWYHMPNAMRLRGPVQLASLDIALLALERRHEILRTTFTSKDRVNMQVVHPFTPKELNVVALLGGDEEQINQALEKEETTLFNLETEPGWRATLFQIGEFDHILSLVMHHIISDGWSIDVLHRDLETFYSAALRGQDPLSVVDPLPIQYSDYSMWQRQPVQLEEQQRQLEFWVKELENSQPAEFICDKARPATLTGKAGLKCLKIEGPIHERLQDFCKSRGVTAFSTLLAAFRATHFRLTGKADATIGNANANRDQWELKDIVGFFVNMQCLRITIEEESFKQLVEQVHQTSIKCFSNQSVPFEKIVSKLQRDRDLSRHPLVQIAFAYHAQSDLGTLKLEGMEIEPVGDHVSTKFDLEFHAMQQRNGLEIQVVYSTDLYGPKTITNMLSIFEKVLENGLSDPDVKITSLPLLSNQSFSDLDSEGLIEIHPTNYARDSSIIDVFKQQVYSSPSKIAAKDSSAQLTFAELDRQSDLIASWLRKRSLKDEELVGVLSPRSCETIVAFLGILKANLAYLPLDVKTPGGRMEAILSTLEGDRLVLMGNGVQPPSLSLTDIKFMSIADVLTEEKQEPFQPDYLKRFSQPTATSLAYVMFTSGSTGKPKGVMIEHRGVVRLTTKNNLVQHLTSDDTWAHMANIAFDVSTTEIYAAILNGITVICIDHMTVLDHTTLEQTFTQEKIRTALFTPALLKQCLRESPATVAELTTLKMGGDRVDPQDVSQARKLVNGPIMNCYGPTENTGCSTAYTLQDEDTCVNGMPIGRAISNSGAYVVDAEMRIVPVGVVGELVVTGDGLARGYLDPKHNINRFVTLEIGNKKVRAYRTGDYVRYRPTDSQLDFFGRIDGQIKVRGHRVETGEIENVLRSDPLISDAIVILHSVNDTHRLAGFVISHHTDLSIGPDGNDAINDKPEANPSEVSEKQRLQERLQKKLQAHLPPYMVPHSLTVLEAMPLNINGKVDRQALIEKIEVTNNVHKTIRHPVSKAQRQMQSIWAKVLGLEVDTIGLDDNFFQLGGDSITAMRVVGEARKVGTKLAVADIFRYKSLEELAKSLQTLDNARIEQNLDKMVLIDPTIKSNLMAQIDSLDTDISSEDVSAILPTTSSQLDYIVGGIEQGQFCNYIHVNLGPELDLVRFKEACISTMQRFPILRARFLLLDGKYWQVIPRHTEISVEVQDVSEDLDEFSHAFCLKDTKEFLPTQPPFGASVFKHPTQGFQMTIRISHAQYDGVCFSTILRSISDAYEGKPMVPIPDYSRFLSYAAHRRCESIDYWKNLLQGSSPTIFPSHLLSDGNPKPTKPEPALASATINFPSLSGNITSATLISAAWAVLLSLITGKNDVVYGHVVNGRNSNLEGIEDIVGICLNNIPVRVNVGSHKTSSQLLSFVQNQVLDIGESDTLGYKDIAKYCTDWPEPDKFEFNTLLHHQNIDEHPEAGFTGAKSRIQWFNNPEVVPPPNITVITYPQGDDLLIKVYANTDVITTKMVERIPEVLGKIIWDLGQQIDAPLPSKLDGIDV